MVEGLLHAGLTTAIIGTSGIGMTYIAIS